MPRSKGADDLARSCGANALEADVKPNYILIRLIRLFDEPSPQMLKKSPPESLGQGTPTDPWNAFLDAIVERWRGDFAERKQDRSRRRDQEILRAALRVFARDGISRSRIGDIASEAGMAISTLYEYYPSKEELAYAVPLSIFGEFYAEYAAAVAGKKAWRERLRLYLWLAVDFARRNPEWARTLYLEIWPSVLVSETTVRHAIDDYARIVIEIIRQGSRAGEWPADQDPYETTAILNGSVNQVIITWLIYRKPHDLMKAASSIIDRTMTLLAETPAEPRTVRRAKPVPKASSGKKLEKKSTSSN